MNGRLSGFGGEPFRIEGPGASCRNPIQTPRPPWGPLTRYPLRTKSRNLDR